MFLLIINLIFLINVSCLKRNLTSQCRTFVCISYDRTYDQKILNLCIKMGTRRNSRTFIWVKDGTMYIGRVWSQNDNFKTACTRANRNPKRMIVGIFGGINSLGLQAKKIERSQNIHDQNANVVTMLCTLTAKLPQERRGHHLRIRLQVVYWLHMNSKKWLMEAFNWFSLSRFSFRY